VAAGDGAVCYGEETVVSGVAVSEEDIGISVVVEVSGSGIGPQAVAPEGREGDAGGDGAVLYGEETIEAIGGVAEEDIGIAITIEVGTALVDVVLVAPQVGSGVTGDVAILNGEEAPVAIGAVTHEDISVAVGVVVG